MFEFKGRNQSIDHDCEGEVEQDEQHSLAYYSYFEIDGRFQWINIAVVDTFLLLFQCLTSIVGTSNDEV